MNSFNLLCNIVSCIDNIESAEIIIKKYRKQITVENAVVLVMVRIKSNISFKKISVIFNVKPSFASKCFRDFLPILKEALAPAIYWPTKEETKNNLPKYFLPDYIDCLAISDATEVEIETPKSLPSRIKCYSHYKGKIFIIYMSNVYFDMVYGLKI